MASGTSTRLESTGRSLPVRKPDTRLGFAFFFPRPSGGISFSSFGLPTDWHGDHLSNARRQPNEPEPEANAHIEPNEPEVEPGPELARPVRPCSGLDARLARCLAIDAAEMIPELTRPVQPGGGLDSNGVPLRRPSIMDARHAINAAAMMRAAQETADQAPSEPYVRTGRPPTCIRNVALQRKAPADS